ncbi:MAG TPA: gephyrin-like molybdotransferase Glp [Acidimicrobiia bacterium]|nr:gephyrin-like molybdotransferase Glp [Acidimicrobiia bacterium]
MTSTSLEAVQEAILAAVSRLEAHEVDLADALGLVLAVDVTTTEPVPPFANTAMDGYAVRAHDTTGATPEEPARLHVVGDLPAGKAPDRAVEPGAAIRIMTGAPMPDGADAVVMVECTRRDGDDGVLIEQAAQPGDHVRRAGGDLAAGAAVFPAGTVVQPAHVGVLASIGVARVPVVRRARVGVLSTGDELTPVDVPGPLAAGRIRDSNRPMLVALARQAGCDAVDLGIAVDDEAGIVDTLRDAVSRYDAVLTSGGVSVGDYDYVKAALERLGSLTAWQVAIKPAKPLAFGVVADVPVFGLPGNPVSSLVSFECFARPALLQRMGHQNRFRPEVTARAAHRFARRVDGKVHLDRVHLDATGAGYRASSVGAQESNALSTTAAANGLAVLPDGDGVAAGDLLRVWRLDAPADH